MPPKNFTITEINKIKLQQPMEFVFIQAKNQRFLFQEQDASLFKHGTSQKIEFTNDFYLCAFQTTQEFWQLVAKGHSNLAENPSQFNYPTRPVECISWLDVQHFLTVLNDLWQTKEGFTLGEANSQKPGGVFQLPSEVQWEYAARGGLEQSPLLFAGSDQADDVAWFSRNANQTTMPVGLKQANALGLHDMSGNVWEWCGNDFQHISTDGESGITHAEKTKSLRGGSYWSNAGYCRVRNRNGSHPRYHPSSLSIGFRLLFVPSSSTAG